MNRSVRPRHFGMVTTEHSSRYTDYALLTFFQNTPLRAEDRFTLIDNDLAYRRDIWQQFPKIELVRNSSPLSFAQNLNQTMETAAESEADLYFLNNDIIFTPNWLSPLLIDSAQIMSPLGNQQEQHRTENVLWKNILPLETYEQHKEEFDKLARALNSREQKYLLTMILGFFCVKIPYIVYSKLGPLSEAYGIGGGEDTDYCMRAHLEGFPLCYAQNSFVLHFNQRSTGAVESADDKRKREQHYQTVFAKRWGKTLATVAFTNNLEILNKAGLSDSLKKGNFKRIISTLLAAEGSSS